MESLFEVGDIVYVQAKVLTVEEQEDDVRYSVVTDIAKFFCTEKGDKIRRSADSQNMIEKSFNQGKDAFYTLIKNISEMPAEQFEAAFPDIEDIPDLLSEMTWDEIEAAYKVWSTSMNVDVEDIVDYEYKGSVNRYVVVTAYVIIDGKAYNTKDLTEDQLKDVSILNTKVLTLLDPVNRVMLTGIPVHDVMYLGKSIPVEAYLKDMADDMEEALHVDEDITGAPEIKEVTNRNDPNYDEYYGNED